MNSKQQGRRASKAGNPIKRAVRLIRDSIGGEQSAIELLKSQHDEVKALFKKIEKASTRAQKTKLFDELAGKLVGHDAIEREIFYPACEKGMGMNDLLGEALVEHGVVEFSLFQADQARQGKDFSFKCQVLSEIVEHHVQEEEEEFFPKVQRALGKEKLVELGARMKARFEQTQAEDFRPPLHKNLNQVLAGALKTSKRRPAKRRAA
ncbi:MAG: hemerythrin domain-containing protein [Pseudomonadota bacterium]